MVLRKLAPYEFPEPVLVGHTNSATSATTMPLTVPVGATEGDFLVMLVSTFTTTATMSGWTKLVEQNRSATSIGYIFYKPYEGDTTATVVLAGTGSFHQATLQVWRGLDQNEPFGDTASRNVQTTVTNVGFTQAVATTRKNSLVMYVEGVAAAISMTGMTWANCFELTDYLYTSGSNRYSLSSAIVFYTNPTASSLTNVTATRTGSGSAINWFLLTVVLNPG